MPSSVYLQVEDKFYGMVVDHLPPVGTEIQVHKHLTKAGNGLSVEVVAHEWKLEEPSEPNGNPEFAIWIKTKTMAANRPIRVASVG